MEFKLNVIAPRPTSGDLVIEAETPLSGVAFLEEFGRAMRRSVDNIAKYKHVTLGSVAEYTMNVPQSIAIESGRYKESNTFTVIVDKNMLSDFLWHAGSLGRGMTHCAYYPYTSQEAVLTTYVDELAFIEVWASLNFPKRITVDESGEDYIVGDLSDTDLCPNPDRRKEGLGCEGCTCGKYPPMPPRPIDPSPYDPFPGPIPPPPPPPPHHRRHRPKPPHPPCPPPPPPGPPVPDPGLDPRNPPPGTLSVAGMYYHPLNASPTTIVPPKP